MRRRQQQHEHLLGHSLSGLGWARVHEKTKLGVQKSKWVLIEEDSFVVNHFLYSICLRKWVPTTISFEELEIHTNDYLWLGMDSPLILQQRAEDTVVTAMWGLPATQSKSHCFRITTQPGHFTLTGESPRFTQGLWLHDGTWQSMFQVFYGPKQKVEDFVHTHPLVSCESY